MTQIPETENKFLKSVSSFVCRHALWIVLAFGAVTAALAPFSAKLKLRANFLDLLPAEHPSIKNLKELVSHVGGTSFLIAVIESKDEKASVEATRLFAEKAASFKHVDYVDNRTDVPEFSNRKLLFLNLQSTERLKKNIEDLLGYYRRQSNPFYVDLLDEEEPKVDEGLELEQKVYKIGGFSAKNQDTFMQVILIKPKHPVSDFTKTQALFEECRTAFAEIEKDFKKPVTLGLTGPYRTRFEEYRTIKHDLAVTGLIVTALLVLINLIAFPNIRSLIYVYLPLAMGQLWVWAFTEFTIGYLNLITAFLAAILFGMGSDYSLHILVNFEEDLKETGSIEKSVERTYTELWKPMWSSVWTTAAVFFAMMISQFEGFRHFGFIAGIGIAISFVVILFVQPSLIVLVERHFPLKRRETKPGKDISRPVIYSIIGIGLLFSVFSVTQIPKASFNYNFMDLQAKGDDSIDLALRVGEHFGVHLNPVVFITPNRAVAGKLADDINHYVDTNKKTLFDFAAAITSHVPSHQEDKIRVLGEIDGIIEKYQPVIQKLDEGTRTKINDLRVQLKPTTFTLKDLPEGIQSQYEGEKKEISAVFIYPAVRILHGDMAKKFVQEARDFPIPPGVKLAGEPLIYADILKLIERDTPVALIISTLVVFILILIHFRRLDHALWVHVPLVIGCLWMIGMMGISGLKFNFFNMVIMPSILGVGIDNGIYIFDRYKKHSGENFFETMRKSVKGVLLASGTSIAAFGSIMFATHQGMATMGKLGFFGFLSVMLASIVFVPALIEFFELKYSHLFRRDKES